MDYTEDTLVQQTTADYLEQRLDWAPITTRTSDREVVLIRTLHERLVALNPGLPGAAGDEPVARGAAPSIAI